MPILMLWSAPRSRSTAFYRMMIERGDFTGVHEPWQPSDRPEWLGGFSHWFTGVAASSGLGEVPGRRSLDADQHPLLSTYLAYHLPFYQELYQRRLVVLAARGGVDVMSELLA